LTAVSIFRHDGSSKRLGRNKVNVTKR